MKQFKISKIKSKLIYKASSDGPNPNIYHQKCDEIPKTLCLIKTKENLIFGGYINIKIINGGNGENKEDKDAFIFSLALKKIYLPKKNQLSLHFNSNYGPIFGNNTCGYPILVKGQDFFKIEGYSCKLKECPYENFINDYEINGGKQYFQIDEIEIFQLLF